jgi:c-di-GMP-binding flagellar brake protein YcgR
MTAHERRRQPRVPLAVHVDLRSADNFYTATTRDVSTGGLFIELTGASRKGPANGLRIGTLVQVLLRLEDERHAISAEVVWELVDDAGSVTGIGVRFSDLAPRAKSSISAFMARRAPHLLDEITE